MNRVGYDCTGVNAMWVKANLPPADLMFWYGTGSPDIEWTLEERALFPHAEMVEIDQGGAGTPIPTAVVRDVENGAWAPGQAVNKAGWHVPRPTLYGSRNTFTQVVADGWQGDYWLAWPGWNGEQLPAAKGVNIVAVQDAFESKYDHNTILDTSWPLLPPSPLSMTIVSRNAHMAIPVQEGADHYVIKWNGLTIMEVAAVPGAEVIHPGTVVIPGFGHGTVTVYAIISSVPKLIGTIVVLQLISGEI